MKLASTLTGSRARAHKVPKTSAPDRRCECGTKLSIYNHGTRCAPCETGKPIPEEARNVAVVIPFPTRPRVCIRCAETMGVGRPSRLMLETGLCRNCLKPSGCS